MLAQIGRKLLDRGAGVVWLTCDEDDANLPHPISSIVQAVEFAGIISATPDMSNARQVAALWKVQYGACLIIYDFEKAATPETERFLDRLYDRLNPQFLIPIASRQPLGSWFLRREVAGEALSWGVAGIRGRGGLSGSEGIKSFRGGAGR